MTNIFLLNTKTVYATDTVDVFTGIVAVTVWYSYVANIYSLNSYINPYLSTFIRKHFPAARLKPKPALRRLKYHLFILKLVKHSGIYSVPLTGLIYDTVCKPEECYSIITHKCVYT